MTGTDLVRHEAKSSIELAPEAWTLAQKIAQTEFVPKALRGKPEAVLACILTGHEAGITPMQALAKIHIIDGRPSMAAELMRALVLAAGHEIEYRELTSTRCVVEGRRRGGERWTTIEWTIEDARQAQLTGKDNWRKHPRNMLQARATGELCRLVFPDVLAGISYTPEELGDEDFVEVLTGRETEGGKAPTPRSRKKAAKAITATAQPTDADPLPDPPSGEIPDLPPAPGDGDVVDDVPADDQADDVAEGVLEPMPDDGSSGDDVDEQGDPLPPVEDADVVDPWEGDGGFVDEEPPLERGRTMTGPAMIAVRISETFGRSWAERTRGVSGENVRALRLAVTSALVGRELTSSKELTPDEVQLVLSTLSGLPEGTTVVEVLGETRGAPADAPAAEPRSAETVTDAPPTSVPPSRPAPEPVNLPDRWNGEQWREFLRGRGAKVTEVLREARSLASRLPTPANVGTLDDLAGLGIADDLVGYVEDLALQRGK